MGIFGNGITQNQPIIAVDTFTSDNTWSCCPGTNCIKVLTVGGGGGGGGGVVQLSLNRVTGGAGGGAGGVVVCDWPAWRFGTEECVIVGAGGAGGAYSDNCFQDPGNPGDPGGDSCFGALQIGAGGDGGEGGYSDNIDVIRVGGAGGNGSPNGGNINVGCANTPGGAAYQKPGAGGAGWSVNYDLPTCSVEPTVGGECYTSILGVCLGLGGFGAGYSSAGSPGCGYGAGGGGGAGYGNAGSPYGTEGGAGDQGVVKVIQYTGEPFPTPPEPCAQTFTESGTWACCTGAIYIEVIAVGAGGHGGVGNNTPTERFAGSAGGAGGGAGGFSCATLLSFGATECVIVGYNSDTCFGSSVVAYRGQNGGNGFCSVSFDASMPGGAGGTGSTVNGAPGGGTNYSSTVVYAGNGGSCTFGGGGAAGQGKYTCQFGLLSSNLAVGGVGNTSFGLTGGYGGDATTTAGQPGQPYGAGGAGGSVPGQLGGTGSGGIIKIIQHFYVPI
jgi:hypothetical protein